MTARQFLLSGLTLLLVANLDGQNEPRFAVLRSNAAHTIPARVMGDVDSHGTWEPTREDIDGLEGNLSQISGLKITGWASTIRIEHPERYFRQYIGVTHAGQRRIYINAFCDDPPPSNWRNRLYTVVDGDICYWQALYDTTSKKFSNLTMNARA